MFGFGAKLIIFPKSVYPAELFGFSRNLNGAIDSHSLIHDLNQATLMHVNVLWELPTLHELEVMLVMDHQSESFM